MAERSAAGMRALARRRMSRRDFLKMSGAGLAGATVLGAASCGGGGGSSGDLIFSMGPDDTGTLPDLIDRFNKQHKGEFQVKYREMPSDTGQYFDQLRTEFQAGGGEIDVIGGDVIWPAQFAAQGWIVDFSDRMPESEQSKYLPGPIESLTYDGKIWGVPWYTDAGMLYYRKDLLEQSGISAPPKTWPELQEMALQVSQDTGTKYGFVFQGSDYEGGVCNGCEYIFTHGGNVLDPADPNKVVIDSPEAIAGLTTEQSMTKDKVAPLAVSTYTEEETDPAFLNGDAVFARNWPYMYALAGTSDFPKVKPEQIAVAPLPVGDPDPTIASTLGGWNFLVNAASDLQEEAWEFIKFMTTEQNMKYRAVEATLLPTLKSLYDDPEVVEAIPVIKLGKEAIEHTKPRPVSPYYGDMSLEMAEQFASVVKGDTSPEQAAKALQKSLENIIEQAS
jgi:multiple sugar transport system substrate-binding protein